jgi:hypothetical protein
LKRAAYHAQIGREASSATNGRLLEVLGPLAEALIRGDALVVEALGIHYVAQLQSQASQRGDLFGAQHATNSNLGLNSEPQLCGLCGAELVDALFDQVFVSRFGVECLVECDVRFTHAAVSELSFVFVTGDDLPDCLSLVGRESQLLDRISRYGRILLGQRDGRSGKDK